MADGLELRRREALRPVRGGSRRRGADRRRRGAGGAPAPPASDTVLWYAQPAATWVEALPVGNGRISAMVHGGTGNEYLPLNEDTLWSGGPYDPANRDALAALPEVRRMVFDGRYAEAAELTKARLMGTPLRQSPYGTIGSLVIDRAGTRAQPPARSPSGLKSAVTPEQPSAAVAGYRRELDLDGAVATTRWEAGGTVFRR